MSLKDPPLFPWLLPVTGSREILYILGAFIATGVVVILLQQTPPRFRKYLILAATFTGGLFYTLEFFLPVHAMPTLANPKQVGNFLTPAIVSFGVMTQIIAAWTAGLGVINLVSAHSKKIIKKSEGSFNSIAFFIALILMTVFGILVKAKPNDFNKSVYDILFYGGFQAFDATMFSMIAFYIVSAAYRAFRVKSTEATLLLCTAFVVMLGQIAVGQMLTKHLPAPLHVEVIRNWILTIANAAATRAIAFGLGIGSLAAALRIWLGLERGSYFEGQD